LKREAAILDQDGDQFHRHAPILKRDAASSIAAEGEN